MSMTNDQKKKIMTDQELHCHLERGLLSFALGGNTYGWAWAMEPESRGSGVSIVLLSIFKNGKCERVYESTCSQVIGVFHSDASVL